MQFIKNNLFKIRLIYPILMIVGILFSIFEFSFIHKGQELAAIIVYYIIGVLTAISFFVYDIKRFDLIIIFIYPILMAISPIPYETAILIMIAIAIVKNLIKRHQNRIMPYLLGYLTVCILIGGAGSFLYFLFHDFTKNTVLSTAYSPNKQYRVDVVDSDQGALGGDRYADLYRIYFNTLQHRKSRLYNGPWGENPKVEWIDKEKVKVDDKIINIYNS